MSNRRLVPLNVVSLPTAPAGVARAGDIYHNSTDGNLYVSDGTAWVSLGGADGPYNSSNFAADFSARTTDDLAEGTNRLYFTVQRARSATAGVYDPAGSADAAEQSAKAYSDSLSGNYDPVGSAASALLAAEQYTDSAIQDVVDSAPGALDTLNELASALNDDANFAATVTNHLAGKASQTDFSGHLSNTTNVHGIPDTSTLETQTGAQSKANSAQVAAELYADSLAVNYDPAGSAAAAELSARTYTDQSLSSYTALPSQTGQSGKYLTTDGTSPSWVTIETVGPADTLQSSYSPPSSPTVGSIYFDRSLNAVRVYDGSGWGIIGMGSETLIGGTGPGSFAGTFDGGLASTTFTATAPVDGGLATSFSAPATT